MWMDLWGLGFLGLLFGKQPPKAGECTGEDRHFVVTPEFEF